MYIIAAKVKTAMERVLGRTVTFSFLSDDAFISHLKKIHASDYRIQGMTKMYWHYNNYDFPGSPFVLEAILAENPIHSHNACLLRRTPLSDPGWANIPHKYTHLKPEPFLLLYFLCIIKRPEAQLRGVINDQLRTRSKWISDWPMMRKAFITRFIIIFINMVLPFSAFGDLSPSPGHIVSSAKLQDAVIHGGVLTDQGEHCDHHFHHSWIFSFHSIEGLSPPSGHIFHLSVNSITEDRRSCGRPRR